MTQHHMEYATGIESDQSDTNVFPVCTNNLWVSETLLGVRIVPVYLKVITIKGKCLFNLMNLP